MLMVLAELGSVELTGIGEPANDNRDPDVLDADQVAAMLGINRKTVYEAAGRGEIPCRRLGRRLLFYRPAVVAWLGHARPLFLCCSRSHWALHATRTAPGMAPGVAISKRARTTP